MTTLKGLLAHPPISLPFTEPLHAYLEQHIQMQLFVDTLPLMASQADLAMNAQATAILGPGVPTPHEVGLRLAQSNMMGLILDLCQPMLLEMLLSRSVDSFLAYLSELMALVFKTRPQMMKAAEAGEDDADKVPLDLILQFKDMDDLIAELTDRRVTQLSHRSVRDLFRYFSKRLGFRLFEVAEQASRAGQLVEVRNVVVHNRAIVNRLFLSRQPNYPAKLGDKLQFSPEEVYSDLKFLAAAVCNIDSRAIKHFGLPVAPKTDLDYQGSR